MSKVISWLVPIYIAMVMMALSSAAYAQDDMPKCANDLNSCGPFINSTTVKPPTTCCTPLEVALKDELPCICNIFSNVELIQALSINITEALTLPSRCGIEFDLVSECQALLAPAMAPSPGSDSFFLSPAGSPLSSLKGYKKKNKNAGSSLSKIGSVVGSGLILTMMVFN